MQNIPSHRKDIRLLFCAGLDEQIVNSDSDTLILYKTDDIYTFRGWVSASEIRVGDVLLTDDNLNVRVQGVSPQDDRFIINFEQQ